MLASLLPLLAGSQANAAEWRDLFTVSPNMGGATISVSVEKRPSNGGKKQPGAHSIIY